MKLTLFQARYIQWLTLIGCSLRATAGNFYSRYKSDLSQKINPTIYEGFGGSQLDEIFLRESAIEKLLEEDINPIISVYDNNIGYDDDSYEIWKESRKKRKRYQHNLANNYELTNGRN